MPCIGVGGMKEYTEFIKEGNFSPMSVLNPDLGMASEIFAMDRKGDVSGRMTGMSGRMTGLDGEVLENVNMDEAHAKVTEMLNKIEKTSKTSGDGCKTVFEKPVERRYKGRRRKISVGEDISQLTSLEQGRALDTISTNSANSSRSSGYHSQPDVREVNSIGRIGELQDDFGTEG